MRYKLPYKLFLICTGALCALLMQKAGSASAAGNNAGLPALADRRPDALPSTRSGSVPAELEIVQYPARMTLYRNCVEKIRLRWFPAGTSAGEVVSSNLVMKPTEEGIAVRTDSLFAPGELISSTGAKAAFYRPVFSLLDVPAPAVSLTCSLPGVDKLQFSRSKCQCALRIIPDKGFAQKHPEEVKYELNKYSIHENGCFGGQHLGAVNTRGISLRQPIQVDFCAYESQLNLGMSYYVILDSIYRYSADGAAWEIPLSYQEKYIKCFFTNR